ncbi:MAG TPA: hypothetical protein VEJ18_22380 [Planctomycetota bacterium]|nr:hypothetical protein [Planctomycetota bacterium]
MIRALAVCLGLLSLPGCDVAVAGILASRAGKSSSSSSSAPDLRYHLWVADLSALSAAQLDQESTDIAAAGGNPSSPRWTLAASGTAFQEVDLSTLTGTFDTVLVQAPKGQTYQLDGLEILQGTGIAEIVRETIGSTGIRSSFFANAGGAADFPDGSTADSDVTAPTDDKAFLFFRFSAPVVRFRIYIRATGAARVSGEVEYGKRYQRPGDQLVGGAAINSAARIHLGFRESAFIGLLRFDSDGTLRDDTAGNDFFTIEPSAASIGSPAVAIDANNNVIIGVTRTTTSPSDNGNIRVRKYAPDMLSQSWTPKDFISSGVDRVEWNGLAVLAGGDVIVAGGTDFGIGQGVGHFMRRLQASDGTDLWSVSPPAPPADAGTTYWFGVAASGSTNIYSTGDLTTTLGPVAPYSRHTIDNPTGTLTDNWSDNRNEAGNTAGRGNSVGIDSAGNVYVGGYYTRSATGRDMVILRYTPSGPPASVHLNPVISGDDEILDIAVASDGTVFAVGYETVGTPNQGKNLILLHVNPLGTLVRKWSLHGALAGGADRGVSVAISADSVYVVGEVTLDPDGGGAQPPETDIVVRRYVR